MRPSKLKDICIESYIYSINTIITLFDREVSINSDKLTEQ